MNKPKVGDIVRLKPSQFDLYPRSMHGDMLVDEIHNHHAGDQRLTVLCEDGQYRVTKAKDLEGYGL